MDGARAAPGRPAGDGRVSHPPPHVGHQDQDLTTTQRYMHLSPAHKDAAIRLLDRRPVDDRDDAPADDHISRIKMTATSATSAPTGAATVGDGLETSLRPEPESNPSV